MAVHASSTAPSSPPAAIQRSPWLSPVPYLFGGLAAMLGLIAFALLILAYSYWKFSGYMYNNNDGNRDLESGNSTGDVKPENYKVPFVFEEKYLVIMAGEAKPTCLATLVSSRTMSFGSSSCRRTSTEKSSELEMMKEERQGNHESLDPVS